MSRSVRYPLSARLPAAVVLEPLQAIAVARLRRLLENLESARPGATTLSIVPLGSERFLVRRETVVAARPGSALHEHLMDAKQALDAAAEPATAVAVTA